MRHRRALMALLVLGAALLTGCSSTVSMKAAENANDPRCAAVTVRLNDVPAIAGNARRNTDAQATAAWGNPSVVLLTCGLPEAVPTSALQCVSLRGIDWLVDDSRRPLLTLTTYGRDPAVQLFIDTTPDAQGRGVSANDVIGNGALAAAIATIPAKHACTARPGADTVTPSPSAAG